MRKFFMFILPIIILTLSGCIQSAVNDYRDGQPEILILPNEYRLYGGNPGLNFIRKKPDGSPQVVEPSVEKVGWNDVYVLYKRVDYDNKTEHGLLDTEKGTIEKLDSNIDIQKQLNERGIGPIEMFDVNELVEKKRK